MAQIENVLATEKTRLSALLNAVPAPSNYVAYALRLTLAHIDEMEQKIGEAASDYEVRINRHCQAAKEGLWAHSFWNVLAAAVASDTADGPKAGIGRGA